MSPKRKKGSSRHRRKTSSVERLVPKRWGSSAAGRIGTAAVLGALGTLVRKHPLIAMELAGAGLKKAGKAGVAEIKETLIAADGKDLPS